MYFITNPKFKIATATAGSIALLLAGSLSAASAADSKASESKENKPACTENMRNIGTAAAPICISNGASAYEIAVKLGYNGSSIEWIASLKGAKGDQGLQGLQGNTGEQGLKGDKGDQGNTGEQGLKGDKGDQGDKGDKGDAGAAGTNGADGKDANVIGTACSFDTAGEHGSVHHTGVWGFGQILGNKGSKIAVYGCVLAANDSAQNGDD